MYRVMNIYIISRESKKAKKKIVDRSFVNYITPVFFFFLFSFFSRFFGWALGMLDEAV